MQTIILILTIFTISISQTINDVGTKDLAFFEKFEHWYTGTVAGDSSAHYFKLYQAKRINHAEQALKYFKNAYTFAQKNDKYALSNQSINFYFIYQLIRTNNKENTILAEQKINDIKFSNERNVYVKRFLNVKSELISELKTRQKRFKIENKDESEENYNLEALRSNYYYSLQIRLNNASNSYAKEVVRLVSSTNRTMEFESPSIPIGLGFNFGDNKWKFAFSYDIAFFNLSGKADAYDITHSGHVSLISLNANYLFYDKEDFNLYALAGLDQYSITFGELNKNQTKTGSNGITKKIVHKAKEETESSLGFNFGIGIEYYIGKDSSVFSNFSNHTLFDELEYTDSSFSYITIGFLYHMY